MDRRTKLCWIGPRDSAFERAAQLWEGQLDHAVELRPYPHADGGEGPPQGLDVALLRIVADEQVDAATSMLQALGPAGVGCCVVLEGAPSADSSAVATWLERGAHVVAFAGGLDRTFMAQLELLSGRARDARTLRALAQHLPIGVALLDHSGEVVFQSSSAPQLALGAAPQGEQPAHVVLPDPDGVDPDLSLSAAAAQNRRLSFTLHDPATDTERAIERTVLPVEGGHLFLHVDHSERAEARRALAAVERSVLVGEIARGVVHDLNNVFCVIESFAELATDGIDPEDPRLEDMKEISNSSKHGAGLVGRLVTFARKAHGHVQRVDIADVVRKLTPLAKDLVGRGCELGLDVDPPRPIHANCELALLEQVVLEALAIARGAAHRAHRVHIRVSAEEGAGASVSIELSGAFPDEDPELDRFRVGRLSELSKELSARLSVSMQSRQLHVTLALPRAAEP